MTIPAGNRPGVALVVGASRGLGLCLARELGSRGHHVVIAARNEAELTEAVQDLRDRGYAASSQVCDVADEAAVRATVDRVEAQVGPVEVAICVAGVIEVGPLDALTRDHFVEAIDIMLWGPINVSLAVSQTMRRRGGGRIGVITSVGGLVAPPHLLPYATAKFGAVGFTRGLRAELAGTGVTVTTVAPGLMRTGSHLRARFVGDQAREYAWFATAASMPLLSMSADRAAARIVTAVLAGRPMLLLTPLASVAFKVNALLPNVTAGVLGLTARLLPDAPPHGGDGQTLEGRDAKKRLRRSRRVVLGRLTTLGNRAAKHNHER